MSDVQEHYCASVHISVGFYVRELQRFVPHALICIQIQGISILILCSKLLMLMFLPPFLPCSLSLSCFPFGN